ncbi:MAG: glycoside hydrolase family 31 protein [Bacteroidales bacterium]
MRIKFITLQILLLAFTFCLNAQNENRKYKSFKNFGDRLEVYTNEGNYTIKPYTDYIIETTFVPKGETFNPESHAVILKPEAVVTEINEDNSSLSYFTFGMMVKIEKSPFQISYYYKDQFLISEKNGYIKTDTTDEIEFNLEPDEVLYGGGARVLGMNRRGKRLQLYNRAHYGYETHSELMNYTMPIVISSKVYTIHFDNAPIGFLDLDSKNNNTLKYETISGRKTYQVIAGDSWPDLMDQYTKLTGKQPIPPRWAFGNFSSRFGYHTEKEVRETVSKFKEDGIPLDAVVIDIYWFGADIQGHMGNLEFLLDSFPTPDKMISDFEEMGVKTILVTEPFILTTSSKWQEAVDKKLLGTDNAGNPYTYDFYFGNTGLIDIYKPEANEWFWNIYKALTKRGVGGWWGDLGEPEVHPSALQHATGSADEVHNIYGHNWAELIYEGYKKDFPDQRPFILMRAGYSGSQQFGMIPWSGDVSRSWGGLKPQTEIALQMGMQGLAYMHSDLGGFAGGEVFEPELYNRWLQYGIFQPIFRPHAQEHIPAEPVFHDKKTKALAKESIEMRYRLLPYNYTLAFENNQTGMPFMRPLFFEDQNNRELYEVAETYFWGDDFLVTPITEAGLEMKEIYFPQHSNWIDFYTDKTYIGGQSHEIPLVNDHIPVFVRAGAFIPMVEPVQSTKYYTTENLEIHYYFDPSVKESKGELYDDDGMTADAFAKGKYELLKFSGEISDSQLKISLNSKIGKLYNSVDRKIKFVVHNFPAEPNELIIANNNVPFSWSQGKKTLEINFSWEAGQAKDILIKFQLKE